MKKEILILLLLVSFPALAATKSQDIKISLLKYEPIPAEPGSNVKIWLNFENVGPIANNVRVRLKPQYPILPVGQKEYLIPIIPAIDSRVLEVYMLVDINAPNGVYDLVLEYKTDQYADAWTEVELPINVDTGDVVLTLDSYTVQPQNWVGGKEGLLTMTLENRGRVGVRNVDVTLDTNNIPFLPLGTGSTKRVQAIAGGAQASVSFKIIPSTEAGVGIYQLPISFTYIDTKGKRYNESTSIALVLKSPPDTALTVSDITYKGKNKPATIGMRFINKGIANLKYVTIILQPSEEYDILSPSKEDYLGNVDNDDFENFEFLISPKKKTVTLKLAAEYLDDYNKEYHEEYTLPVNLLTEKELDGGGSSAWIIILILVVAGIYWYRKKK